jgi:hypothetical protein
VLVRGYEGWREAISRVLSLSSDETMFGGDVMTWVLFAQTLASLRINEFYFLISAIWTRFVSVK